MSNLNNCYDNCVVADSMVEYFTQVDRHKDALNKKLQERLGEYASIDTKTVADECGGNMLLEFGLYDLDEEILNFADMVAKKIDITEEVAKSTLNSYLDLYNITVDMTWEEEPKKNEVKVFIGSDHFKDVKVVFEADKIRYEVLEALEESISEFIDSTINESINLFNKCWVYEYSANLNY